MTYEEMLKQNADEAAGAKQHHDSPEERLQKDCVQWFRYQYMTHWRQLFAVPNGGSRNKKEAANMKAAGVVAGVADLILLIPNDTYGALCIELKHGKNSQTDFQKDWQTSTEAHGNKYAVIYSLEDFISLIKQYLKTAKL
jgi:hypothetical protein